MSRPPLNIGILMRDPWVAVNDQVVRRQREKGHSAVRPAHGAVFQHIDAEGTRVSVLAERARISKQSMAELVAHLEKEGYLERIPDPTDRRAKLVRETRRGRELVKIARAAIAELEEEWAELLGRRKARQLRALLEELNTKLDGLRG
jgi:DNA-binding MarR family transcriptional regulator